MTAPMKIKVSDLLKLGFVEAESLYSNQLVYVINDSTQTQEYISVMYDHSASHEVFFASVHVCRKFKAVNEIMSFQLPIQPYTIEDLKALIGIFKREEK